MRRSWRLLLAGAGLGLAAVAAWSAATPGAVAQDKVTFRMNWYWGGIHAPFALAKERGYFEKAGVNVEILEGRGSATTVQLVGTKSDTFGWADGVSLTQNAVKGVPVKAVATILNVLPYAVVSLEETNIRTVKDLEGKTLAITPGDGLTQTWPAVVAANKLNADSIKLIHMDPKAKIPAVTEKQAHALLGGADDQAVTMEVKGFKTRVLKFSELGVPSVGFTVFAHQDTIKERPDLVRKVVAASVKGFEDAVKDPEAAVAALMKLAPLADRETMRRQLAVDLGPPLQRGQQAEAPRVRAAGGLGGDARRAQEVPGRRDQPAGNRVLHERVPAVGVAPAAPPGAGAPAALLPRPLIELAGVSKTYAASDGPVHALEQVSLDVPTGEFLSILGPSGCGKSTLMLMIAGLLAPSAGEIRVGGKPVTRPQTDVGIVFQNPVLLDWRTVIRNVLLQVEARALDLSLYRVRARELLLAVGLEGFEDKYPFELSGGMRQRTAICRALIHDPPLLLMDEPFGALDALTREQMRLDIERLWLERRKTVVFITHSIPEAVLLSDRVVVMSPRPGRIDGLIDIDLPRPRRLEVQESPRFAGYLKAITDLFRARGVLRY